MDDRYDAGSARRRAAALGVAAALSVACAAAYAAGALGGEKKRPTDPAAANAAAMLAAGTATFRYGPFGSEDVWGGARRLHEGPQAGHVRLGGQLGGELRQPGRLVTVRPREDLRRRHLRRGLLRMGRAGEGHQRPEH